MEEKRTGNSGLPSLSLRELRQAVRNMNGKIDRLENEKSCIEELIHNMDNGNVAWHGLCDDESEFVDDYLYWIREHI